MLSCTHSKRATLWHKHEREGSLDLIVTIWLATLTGCRDYKRR